MLGIPAGLAVVNMGEWFLHKYLLHGLGRRKKSFWAFHWHGHHRESRRHAMVDQGYVQEARGEGPISREVAALAIGALVGLPLLFAFPFFTLTVWYRLYRYYLVHRRAHLDEEWARVNLPWHYDHHMGKNQNSNWCVTHPWFDHVMGTRKYFVYDENGLAVEEVPQQPRSLPVRLFDGFKESWATRRPRLPEVPPKPHKQTA